MSAPSGKVEKIKKVSREYDEHCSFLKKTASSLDSNSLKPRVHDITCSSDVGKKISKIGVALIALPDPGIADAVGVALVLSGKYMERKAPMMLKDTYKEFNKISGEIRKVHFL
jgi:hypothetical protein